MSTSILKRGAMIVLCGCLSTTASAMAEVCTRYYLRLLAHDQPGVFAQVTLALGKAGISLASVIQKQTVVVGDPPVEYAEIVLMTHEAKEAANRLDADWRRGSASPD